MPNITLTISSKTYSSWSLRGWLMTKMSGLPFEEIVTAPGDASARAEILLLSPSVLVPCLTYDGFRIWDTLAIGEFLNEIAPPAGLLPADLLPRAHCRAICAEMHSGFGSLRAALPMNLKADIPGFKVWSKAQADINRITEIWRECLGLYGGPYLFGQPTLADAMYAPVTTRLKTYNVAVDPVSQAYCDLILSWAPMLEWREGAMLETEEIEELEVEF